MTGRCRRSPFGPVRVCEVLIVLTALSLPLAGSGAPTDGPEREEVARSARLQECHPDLGTPLVGPLPGGFSVSNLRPGIVNTSMVSSPGTGGTLTVEVTVQDPNGWLDVYTVVVVMYFRAEPQACAGFRMGRNASDINLPEYFFEDLLEGGGVLEDGAAKRLNHPDPVIDETHFRVTFVFRKVAANFIEVRSWDRRLEGTRIQFEMDPTLRPQLVDNAVIPWGASLVSAAVATAMLMMMRLRSNQLARLAERRAGRARAAIAGPSR